MIKTNLKTLNIELTQAISEYVDKKLMALHKYIKEEEELLANVEVGKTSNHHKSGDIFRAEIKVNIGGKDFFASVEKDDLYAAIDEVKDEITKELSRDKKKSEKLFRAGAAKVKNILKMIKFR